MAFTLLKPSGIDLSQTFAFTGTVSGAGGGKIGQIVQNIVEDGNASTSSSTYQTTNLDVQITPTATSSKILVIMSFSAGLITANKGCMTGLFRDSTTKIYECQAMYNNTGSHIVTRNHMMFLDSPSSTSAEDYVVKVKNPQGDATVYFYGNGGFYYNLPAQANPCTLLTCFQQFSSCKCYFKIINCVCLVHKFPSDYANICAKILPL